MDRKLEFCVLFVIAAMLVCNFAIEYLLIRDKPTEYNDTFFGGPNISFNLNDSPNVEIRYYSAGLLPEYILKYNLSTNMVERISNIHANGYTTSNFMAEESFFKSLGPSQHLLKEAAKTYRIIKIQKSINYVLLVVGVLLFIAYHKTHQHRIAEEIRRERARINPS